MSYEENEELASAALIGLVAAALSGAFVGMVAGVIGATVLITWGM